jgi:hypothetical protein
MDGDAGHFLSLFETPPAMDAPFAVGEPVRFIDRRYSVEGGKVPGVRNGSSNRLRFWQGRGRRLIEQEWNRSHFKVGSLTGGDDKELIYLNETDDGELLPYTSHEPSFRRDLSKSGNGADRKEGRLRDWVFPFNKVYKGFVEGQFDKDGKPKKESFTFPLHNEPAPPAEIWEWRRTGSRPGGVDGVSPSWPHLTEKDTAIPISRGVFFDTLIAGMKLPPLEGRRIPENMPLRPAGYSADQVGITATTRTALRAARNRIGIGVWGKYAIGELEKANAEPVVRQKIIESEGTVIFEAAHERAKREISFNAAKEMFRAVNTEIGMLRQIASFGHNITARLVGLDKKALVADHLREQAVQRTAEIVEESIAVKVAAVREENEVTIETKKRKREGRSYFKPSDILTRRHDRQSSPNAQAVVFVLWDGSTEAIAKRIAMLFCRMVERDHKHVDVILIRNAKPQFDVADGEKAFNGSRPSDIAISTDYQTMLHVLEERYPRQHNHRYLLQVGNGLTHRDDVDVAQRIMEKRILPEFQQVFTVAMGTSFGGTNSAKFNWMQDNAVRASNLRYSDIDSIRKVIPAMNEQYPIPESALPEPKIPTQEPKTETAAEGP